LAGAEYAVDVQFVQELRGREDTSSCPNAPEFVLGVINLRGMLVPLINLRSFFAMSERDANLKTTVIIITLPGENIVLGLVVDAVSDVYDVNNEQQKLAIIGILIKLLKLLCFCKFHKK